MPLIETTPFFHGKAVLVDFDPSVPGPGALRAAVGALVRRVEDNHGDEGELLDGIPELLSGCDLRVRLVARTREAIEFRVTTR